MSVLDQLVKRMNPVQGAGLKEATIVKTADATFHKMAMLKAASEIRRLETDIDSLKKQAHATKIAFRLLQDGQIEIDDFQEKVAELNTKDLNLIEEAIKIAYANNTTRIGNVDRDDEVSGYSSLDPMTSAILGN